LERGRQEKAAVASAPSEASETPDSAVPISAPTSSAPDEAEREAGESLAPPAEGLGAPQWPSAAQAATPR
ncbi:MAG: hypothetical protein LWW77_12940, partial [Propionibacteriales bacterium]|nr:hypothetical protein [Propionibacteriales bacterium]